MSYDILAFDPDAVTDAQFPEWWDKQAEWSEDHTYDDVAVTTPALASFYAELIQTFPPLNGPDAPTDQQLEADAELDARISDYSIGRTLVYGAFSWSQAAQSQELFLDLAAKHGVAVALVSDDSSIVRPKPARKKLWGRK
jgi:hypothetical protein